MEASCTALWCSPACSGAGIRPGVAGDSSSSSSDGRRSFRISARPRRVSSSGGGGFSDEGHLKYYVPPARCGGSKKEEKRRAKLVKRLARDLPVFYSMGFGLESGQGLAGQVKGKMISEAAEFLGQLKQLQAQEEMKRQRKERGTMKAAKMKDCSSSSSSSESSDGECESVLKMSSLRTAIISNPESEDSTIPAAAAAHNCNSAPPPLELGKTGDGIEQNNSRFNLGRECISTSSRGGSHGCSSNSTPVVEKPMDKIEVCIGGKCKKSGALQLLEEFKSKIGIERAVVGCKCMGKCKDGPNVRVLKHKTEEDYVKDVKHTLCIGIGLDDVGTIVTNFFGEKDALLS